MLGKEYSILEIFIGIIIIIGLIFFTQSINITLFQLVLFIIIISSIYFISLQKKQTLIDLKTNTTITETDSTPILTFVNSISYFKQFNPIIYDEFINKIKNFIKLQEFMKFHETNNYKLYPLRILKQNLSHQKKDVLDTFISFEHTTDDRIISIHALNKLSTKLHDLLSKSVIT